MRAAFSNWAFQLTGAAAAVALLPLSLLAWRARADLGPNVDILAGLVFFLVGAYAVRQRPAHLAARCLLLLGTIAVADMALGRGLSVLALQLDQVPWFWLGSALHLALDQALFCALLALCALFPDGRYRRPAERQLVRASWLLVPLVPALLLTTQPQLFVNTYAVEPGANAASPSPMFVPALAWAAPLARTSFWAPAGLLLLAVGTLLLRYRRAAHEQRLQIAWPLLATALLALALVATIPADYGLLPPALPVALFSAAILLLPLALVIGLLRHRLFDLELLLRKSLVYGALWLAITLGYAGLAGLLGIAAGQLLPVSLAVLLTIATMLLFQPLRRQLERRADRWVFGERLSGDELLARFGATLESAFDLRVLLPRVAAAIRQGLGVRWVRVALRPPAGAPLPFEPVAADGIELGEPAQPAVTLALDDGNEQIGIIECGPRLDGQLDQRDHELLKSLGRQTTLAIRNVRLAEELAARLDETRRQARELAESRARIVQAGEMERRRIERNIHDGAQQGLVALLTKLRLARSQLARDPALAARTLAELQADTRQAIEDLRELARGIHPPVLSDGGLLAAIEARAARLPIGVAIEPDGVGRDTRYLPEIEGAAYFVVCEGLANVLKHAAAQHVSVQLAATAGELRVEVVDDGRGFAPEAVPAGGLGGLRDRVEALGGTLQIASRPGAGARLEARLPLREG